MVLTLEVPDEIARALWGAGHADPQRFALEAVAAEGYRENRLTQKQVGEILGFSRIETEDFLARHADPDDYEPGRLAREAVSLRRYSESDNR
jgi:Uncharacterised protein family (UPF0175)